MKYHEKNILAEQLANEFRQGKDNNSIKRWIEEKQLKKYDIDKVIFSAKKILKSEYIDQIIPALKENQEQTVDHILKNLSPELREEIRNEGIKELKNRVKKEISNRAKNGESDEDIIGSLKIKYFSETEIRERIAFYKKYNEAPKGVERDKYLITGISILFIGLLIFLLVKLQTGRPPSLAFLLIIYGGWNIYKAFTPPGVTELSDLNDKFK